jgi:hypothetical protein
MTASRKREEQYRLTLETWFRGIALLLVVIAVVVYPLYALIFAISGSTLSQLIAPVTGIAGAVVGYWFGQARRAPEPAQSLSSEGGTSGGSSGPQGAPQ